MRRRDLLAGAAGLAVLGGGAAMAIGDFEPWDPQESIEAVELPGIEAPGSVGGPVVVPERGSVTVLELFATWCSVCEATMEPLGRVHEEFGAEVQFVSVTNEPLGGTTTEADVAAWWREHGGAWQLARDPEFQLTKRVGGAEVPQLLVFDERNVVTWNETGFTAEGELRSAIETVLGDEHTA
ncbi:TlpA family protein disulfide reductase [Halovivax limisalsi]|uniref:TlpA family protein disulfide reductase n=1 Tax=Halovivax limisalsi TaxID=1453760 RepID=UPI001FFD2035|nr:TlpA disulfide reductase family protein [Halovivax limisalsi]